MIILIKIGSDYYRFILQHALLFLHFFFLAFLNQKEREFSLVNEGCNTLLVGRILLTQREECALESAALHNPDHQVIFLLTNSTRFI